MSSTKSSVLFRYRISDVFHIEDSACDSVALELGRLTYLEFRFFFLLQETTVVLLQLRRTSIKVNIHEAPLTPGVRRPLSPSASAQQVVIELHDCGMEKS
jgi:hypothetical protein